MSPRPAGAGTHPSIDEKTCTRHLQDLRERDVRVAIRLAGWRMTGDEMWPDEPATFDPNEWAPHVEAIHPVKVRAGRRPTVPTKPPDSRTFPGAMLNAMVQTQIDIAGLRER